MCAMLELNFNPASKLFQVDLRPVDPKLRPDRTSFLS
jgi:hypothetical protein